MKLNKMLCGLVLSGALLLVGCDSELSISVNENNLGGISTDSFSIGYIGDSVYLCSKLFNPIEIGTKGTEPSIIYLYECNSPKSVFNEDYNLVMYIEDDVYLVYTWRSYSGKRGNITKVENPETKQYIHETLQEETFYSINLSSLSSVNLIP